MDLFAKRNVYLQLERRSINVTRHASWRLYGIAHSSRWSATLNLGGELKALRFRIPIIFITGHGDIQMSVRAMKAGAIEFLTKPFRDQDLLDAIYAGLEKDRERRQQEAEIATLRQRFESLTPGEQALMRWAVTGRLNKQIATELGTTEATVKNHRSQLMRKIRADSLPELVKMAEKMGIEIPDSTDPRDQ